MFFTLLTFHPEMSSLNVSLDSNREDMSVMSDVHQVPIGTPQDLPIAHALLVEQPWLIYKSTAVRRSDVVLKHGLVSSCALTMVVKMMTTRATRQNGGTCGDDLNMMVAW